MTGFKRRTVDEPHPKFVHPEREREVADRDAAHRYRGFTCLYDIIIIYDCVEINDSVAERPPFN